MGPALYLRIEFVSTELVELAEVNSSISVHAIRNVHAVELAL